jgi:hypothetical protein
VQTPLHCTAGRHSKKEPSRQLILLSIRRLTFYARILPTLYRGFLARYNTVILTSASSIPDGILLLPPGQGGGGGSSWVPRPQEVVVSARLDPGGWQVVAWPQEAAAGFGEVVARPQEAAASFGEAAARPQEAAAGITAGRGGGAAG